MIEVPAHADSTEFRFLIHPPTEDIFVSATIKSTGSWEPHLTKIWSEHIQPGDLVVDIGANIGWFSRVALNKGADVISIEPDPRNIPLLEKNCPDANRVNVALGEASGILKIKHNQNNFGDTQISIDGEIEVEQTTLDAIIGDNAKNIKAIKIDVQGWEPFVIQGGQTTFKNLPKGCLVLLEFSPYMIIQNGFSLTCLDEFFSLFSNSYAMTHKGKRMTMEEMFKWFTKIQYDNRLYADTVNIV